MEPFELEQGIKDAFTMVSEGTAFDRSFEDVVAAVPAKLTSVTDKLATLPSTINGVSSDIIAKASGIGDMISGASSALPDFQSHIASKFDNIMGDISTFSSAQGLSNALANGGAGTSGCGGMMDFFGSITTKGPQAIGQMTSMADQIMGEMDNFTQLGTDLQSHITGTKDGLLSALNTEIANTTDVGKLADLNNIKSQITSQFQTGLSDVRADLSKQAMALLPSNAQGTVSSLVSGMRNTDFSILQSAESINGIAGTIGEKASALTSMISGEQTAMTSAVGQLEQLGAVSEMKSLLSSNPCVQTLMGFVGNSDFLKTLGG